MKVGGTLLAVLALVSLVVAADRTQPKVDKVLVLKADRKLQLLSGETVVREYKIALGRNPVGPKERQGDSKTPEGAYVIDFRNRHSQFHRSLHITYPTAAQRREARRRGYSAGGDIFIHGLPNGQGKLGKAHLLVDWTDGCIAVTNEEIEEIWALVKDGTPIEIKP